MKHILFFTLFISASLFSFSQKRDTFNLFQKQAKRKDVNKELQSHPPSKLDSIYYIKYGTNAGRCVGYCFHEANIDSNNIVIVKKTMREDKNYPMKTDSTHTTSDQWNMLINSIEINSFFSIPEKIGEPGATDRGIEWIEINYTGKTHKVTFDSAELEDYDGIKNLDKLLKSVTHF
jgi:hypothetical protein